MATIIIKDQNGEILEEYDTNNVLWQILKKEHIAEDMSDDKWYDFINDNESEFADEVSRIGKEFVENYG